MLLTFHCDNIANLGKRESPNSQDLREMPHVNSSLAGTHLCTFHQYGKAAKTAKNRAIPRSMRAATTEIWKIVEPQYQSHSRCTKSHRLVTADRGFGLASCMSGAMVQTLYSHGSGEVTEPCQISASKAFATHESRPAR